MENNNYRADVDSYGEIDLKREEIEALDLVNGSKGELHVIRDDRSFHIKVLAADQRNKTYTLRINGQNVKVTLYDKYQVLVHNMGLDVDDKQASGDVVAPMPGLVIDIRCKEGDVINEGDALVILEAMKMENVLVAHGGGTVAAIKVKPGDAVDKGQVLIELQ